MSGERSPIDALLTSPDFKPFSGRQAFRVLELAKKRLSIPPVSEGDVLKAVSSLGTILEIEVAMILALQDSLCQRCGNCCRKRGSIRIRKEELQFIADDLRYEYKRLKDMLRVTPMGDGTFMLRQPCRFLKGNLCSIYSARPGSCRGYPANILIASINSGSPFDGCPIADELLSEVVVKRVLEEYMWREKPDELRRITEKRRADLAKLSGLPQHERIRLLKEGYSRTLRRN